MLRKTIADTIREEMMFATIHGSISKKLFWFEFPALLNSHLMCPSASIPPCLLLQDVVNGIEFARGDPETSWGSVRAAMGHPEPFQLNYISIGNQECSMRYYKGFYYLSLFAFSSCLASQDSVIFQNNI